MLSPLHPHFLVEEKPRRKEGSLPARHNFLTHLHKFFIPKPGVSSSSPKKKPKNPTRRWQLHPEELQEALHIGILPSQKSLQPILSCSKSIPALRRQLRILLADPVVWGGRKSSSLRAVSGASVVWLVFLAGYESLLFLSCCVGGFFFET